MIPDKPELFPLHSNNSFQRQIHSYLKWLPLKLSRPSVTAQYRLVCAPCWGVLMIKKKSFQIHLINIECRINSDWTVPGWTEYVVTLEPGAGRGHVKKTNLILPTRKREQSMWHHPLLMTPTDDLCATGDITRTHPLRFVYTHRTDSGTGLSLH